MSRALLQNVYLFKSFSPKDIEAISALSHSQTYNVGDTIFLRGEAAKALYLIKHGTIKIQHSTKAGDAIDVAALSAGSHFGEMAFVDGQARSATAVSTEPTELIEIPYEKLQVFLGKNAEAAARFYKELAHFVCGRLRVTTNDLGYMREKNLSHM